MRKNEQGFTILRLRSGFTIIELLVVIVIIGILAAISLVSYAGINEKAIGVRIASDLNNNSKLLELYKVEHEEYPRTLDGDNCPDSPVADNQYCLKVSEDDDTLTYEGDGGTGGGAGDTYTLTITDEAANISYEIIPGGTAIAVDSDGSGAVNTTFVNTWGGADNDEAYSTAQTSDGGYVIAGLTEIAGAGSDDAFIAKYTSNGTLSWDKTWGGVDYEQANSIIQTSDGGYAITGETDSFGAGGYDAFIAKFTSDGTLSWDKTWGGVTLDLAKSIIQTSDGGFVITGETDSFGAGGYDAFIAKYTSDGTLSWDKTWGGSDSDGSASITRTSDNSFIITGYSFSYGAGSDDAFIAKFTSDGTLSWDKTWGGVGDEQANSITQTSDDGYVITGETNSYGAGDRDVFITKFTSSGALSWNKTWGVVSYDKVNSIDQTSDGGFVIAGYTSSNDAVSYDAFIAKYTSDGTLSWDRNWGGASYEESYSITQTSDDGYVIAGKTFSYGAGGNDAFIAKYNSSGNIDGCPALMCTDPSSNSSSPTASVSDPTASVSDPTVIVSGPTASVSSPDAVVNIITPPPMTVTFSSDELRVLYPGVDQTVCKEWTVPNGKTIKGFMVSQETEEDYDFFKVSLDGVEKYNKSGYKTDEFVNLSATPGTTLSACMLADESEQDGYGGQVTGVLYD